MKMTRILGWITGVFLGLALVGCDAPAQDDVANHTNQAAKSLSKAASIAFDSVSRKVQQMNNDASPQVQESTRKAVQMLQDQLKNVQDRSPEVERQIRVLEQAIKQLDAQKAWQDLKRETERLVQEARKTGQTLEETERRLRETDRQFRELERKKSDSLRDLEKQREQFNQLLLT